MNNAEKRMCNIINQGRSKMHKIITKRQQFVLSLLLLMFTTMLISTLSMADDFCGIKGTVVNKKTTEPLLLANVILKGTTMGAATDEDGHYFISGVPAGKYQVIVSMIGYKTLTKTVSVSADEVSILDFKLTQMVIPMGEIVVTATKTKHILGDIPVSAHVITKEEMELANVETACQAVKYLPGVYAQGGFGWVKEAAKLQGLDPQYTLLLLDGQKIRGAPKYSADLSQYPAEMIEKIEIIKGPASSLYGSDAISGIINIMTRTAPEKPTGSASAAFGTYKNRIYRLSFGNKMGGLGYFLSYNRRESDGWPDTLIWESNGGVDTLVYIYDRFKDEGFQGSLGYEFAPLFKLVLKSGYFQQEQEENPPEQQRYSLNALGELRLSKASTLKIRGSWFKYNRLMLKAGVDTTDIQHELYEAELNYNHLVKKNLFTLGYHYCKEYHTHFKFDTLLQSGTVSQSTNSFFIQDELEFLPFSLVLGTRVDHHDKWGTVINPNIGVLYRLTKNLKLRGSVGRAFKEPPMCHLYTVDLFQANRWIVAYSDLKPEKSIGYGFGAEYGIGENLLTEVSFFRNDIEDLIETYHTGDSMRPNPWEPLYPVYSYKNIAEVYTQGIEFMLWGQISDWLSGRAGYTWLDSKNKETEQELFYNPRHKLNLELQTSVPWFDFGINLRGEYIGERWGYYIEPGLCPGLAPEPEPEMLESYWLTHIKVNKVITTQVRVFFSVNNILDEKYYEWALRKMTGREFLGGIRLKF